MFKKLTALVVALLLVWIGWGLLTPSHYRIERGQGINAAAAQIYPYVADFRAWPGWWTDELNDPRRDRSYSGGTGVPGATYRWNAHTPPGRGAMVIIRADAPRELHIDYTQSEPKALEQTFTITLTPQGNQTMLTIRCEGDRSLLQRLLHPWQNPATERGNQLDAAVAAIHQAVEGR